MGGGEACPPSKSAAITVQSRQDEEDDDAFMAIAMEELRAGYAVGGIPVCSHLKFPPSLLQSPTLSLPLSLVCNPIGRIKTGGGRGFPEKNHWRHEYAPS